MPSKLFVSALGGHCFIEKEGLFLQTKGPGKGDKIGKDGRGVRRLPGLGKGKVRLKKMKGKRRGSLIKRGRVTKYQSNKVAK